MILVSSEFVLISIHIQHAVLIFFYLENSLAINTIQSHKDCALCGCFVIYRCFLTLLLRMYPTLIISELSLYGTKMFPQFK